MWTMLHDPHHPPSQVGGARWAELPIHLEGSKLSSLSSIIRLFKAWDWDLRMRRLIQCSLRCSQPGSRLPKVQRLGVWLAPSQMSYLATSQLLIDSFPLMQLFTDRHHWTDHLFPLTELMSSRGVASCISNLTYTIYSSPSPMTADLFERGSLGPRGTRLPPSCFRSSLRYVKLCKVAFSNLESKWLTTNLL